MAFLLPGVMISKPDWGGHLQKGQVERTSNGRSYWTAFFSAVANWKV